MNIINIKIFIMKFIIYIKFKYFIIQILWDLIGGT